MVKDPIEKKKKKKKGKRVQLELVIFTSLDFNPNL